MSVHDNEMKIRVICSNKIDDKLFCCVNYKTFQTQKRIDSGRNCLNQSLFVKHDKIKVKSVLLNVTFINFIKHSNKHHLQPSIVYHLLIWDN